MEDYNVTNSRNQGICSYAFYTICIPDNSFCGPCLVSSLSYLLGIISVVFVVAVVAAVAVVEATSGFVEPRPAVVYWVRCSIHRELYDYFQRRQSREDPTSRGGTWVKATSLGAMSWAGGHPCSDRGWESGLIGH